MPSPLEPLSERNPAKNPIKKAKRIVIIQFSQRQSNLSSTHIVLHRLSLASFSPYQFNLQAKICRNSAIKQYGHRIVPVGFITSGRLKHLARPNNFDILHDDYFSAFLDGSCHYPR